MLLLPLAGNPAVDSNVKDISDEPIDQDDNFELFEPAGELEMEDRTEEFETKETQEQDDTVAAPKRSRL